MKTKTQISFAVTAKLISAFVFATRKVQSLYFLNQKFQISSHLLWLYASRFLRDQVRNPEDQFSHNEAQILQCQSDLFVNSIYGHAINFSFCCIETSSVAKYDFLLILILLSNNGNSPTNNNTMFHLTLTGCGSLLGSLSAVCKRSTSAVCKRR